METGHRQAGKLSQHLQHSRDWLAFNGRKEDMDLIEVLCTEHKLDFDWVKDDLLKEFHEKKIRNQDMDDKGIEKIIEKALLKIK